jgi:hypothetical protein
MEKNKKNRSGSLSNAGSTNENSGGRRRDPLPGAPAKSNRQTGDSKRYEKDDSSGAERNTTKRGANSI